MVEMVRWMDEITITTIAREDHVVIDENTRLFLNGEEALCPVLSNSSTAPLTVCTMVHYSTHSSCVLL